MYKERFVGPAAAAAIALADQLKESDQSLFANGVRLGLILTTCKLLSDKSYVRCKQQFVDGVV